MFMDSNTRERPLRKRIAEMDRKLFSANNELLILKKETAENSGSSDSGVNSQALREMEMQFEQESEKYSMTLSQLELAKQEVETAQEEARQSQEMIEEMLANQKDQSSKADEQL